MSRMAFLTIIVVHSVSKSYWVIRSRSLSTLVVFCKLCLWWSQEISWIFGIIKQSSNSVALLNYSSVLSKWFNLYARWSRLNIKAVFHFNCIVAKRSVFHCFVNTQLLSSEYAMFRYDTIEVENGLKNIVYYKFIIYKTKIVYHIYFEVHRVSRPCLNSLDVVTSKVAGSILSRVFSKWLEFSSHVK